MTPAGNIRICRACGNGCRSPLGLCFPCRRQQRRPFCQACGLASRTATTLCRACRMLVGKDNTRGAYLTCPPDYIPAHNARMALYAERAKAGLPLFTPLELLPYDG